MKSLSYHPANLLTRLILEVGAMVTCGIWGFEQSGTWIRYLLAAIFSLMFAALWGVFAVRGDPSRSGRTVVATAGPVRLFIELGLFGLAILALFDLGFFLLPIVFGGVVVLHYLVSIERIKWLFSQ